VLARVPSIWQDETGIDYALLSGTFDVTLYGHYHRAHRLFSGAANASLAAAYQSREVIEAMEADSGVALTTLKVDGGMVRNETLMQFQADILGVPVIRPKVPETTALGAAYAAGLAVGFWRGQEDIRANWAEDKRWEPSMLDERREALYGRWKQAVERTLGWVESGA